MSSEDARKVEEVQPAVAVKVTSNDPRQEVSSTFKGLESALKSVEKPSELLEYLEPEIVEFADKLSVKLFLLRFDLLIDFNKFADYLDVSFNDKVILVASVNDSLMLANLSKVFQSKGATVYDFISQKLPQGTFAFGISRKLRI